MDNKIIAGYLNDFKKDFGLEEENESKLFEMFANYCVISRIHPEAFSTNFEKIESMNLGGGDDTGIDGLGIIVNESLASSIDEIDDLKNFRRRLDVQFIFIQAKTSPKFDASKIGTFIFGVKDFFREESTIRFNDNIKEFKELKDHIYSNSIDFEVKPTCQMYYVTTGKWVGDKTLLGRADSDKADLEKLGIFSSVEFVPIDADSIGNIYRDLKNKVKKQIIFEKRASIPPIKGVREAYIGILPISEYLKLISDSDGKMQKNLFYDNVRDFLGQNSVNNEIANTIKQKEEQGKFAILNNGVTIVANNIHPIGDTFTISDFQIVNGCQTSHVLFNNKEYLKNSKASIPIKLIVTEDYEVANQITKATNRQTEVKVEAFASLEPYHRKLEEHFNSYPIENRIYYARRSNQYNNVVPSIPKERVITLSAQINAFISTFLNEPHSTHRYYGELLKAYQGKLFQPDHNPEMYYVSSFALHTIEKIIKGRLPLIERFFKENKFKHHFLMVLRIIVCGNTHPSFASKKMTNYCEKLYSVLIRPRGTASAIEDTSVIIRNAVSNYEIKYGKTNHRELHRKRNFTSLLITEAEKFVQR
ncbi:MAG: AIPR family protein [Phaeodactylibacter sp.]|nr:AIPR family protein [Phaeodactylibacter sp.]